MGHSNVRNPECMRGNVVQIVSGIAEQSGLSKCQVSLSLGEVFPCSNTWVMGHRSRMARRRRWLLRKARCARAKEKRWIEKATNQYLADDTVQKLLSDPGDY